VRLTSLRGVNLDVFDFDYDLTWMAFFLEPDQRVLGRFGGRTPDQPDSYRNVDGLRFALEAALKRHKEGPLAERPPVMPPRTVAEYPGFVRFGAKSCVHCHHAYDLRREALEEKGTWSLEEVWVFPLPENVGWTLAVNPGNRITSVAAKSPADVAGMKAGDLLVQVNRLPVATFSDVQQALHKAPKMGDLSVHFSREGKPMEATLKLAPGWRQTDLSWRRSLKGLEPGSGLHGDDLSAVEKKQLGLPLHALAFRHGNFPTVQARQAGIQQNDVILGVDGKALEMTARQFDAFIRLNYHKGDTVTVDVLRDGKRLGLRMKLSG
jgi:hypothetical protein